jgi:hypothetical protein
VEILRSVNELAVWRSQEELRALLDRVGNLVTDARFEWDAAAGEEWVKVVLRDRLVSLLRAPTHTAPAYRFAFLLSGDPATAVIRPVLVTNEIEVVELEDFDTSSLSARAEDLTTFTGSPLPPSHAFDPGQFSANDLCFFSN